MNPNAHDRCIELFRAGYHCAECVLMALAESRGIQSDLIPRIATSFSGGIADTGGMCGAVSGAIMSFGLVAGRDAPTDPSENCFALARQFMDRFEARYGSLSCRVLTDCDLTSAEGLRRFFDSGAEMRCEAFVSGAVNIAQDLIGHQA